MVPVYALVKVVILAAAVHAFNTPLLPHKSSFLSLPPLSAMKEERDGYCLMGSLTRQGPVPVFIRLVNPSTYEAAVEKYMALEKCDRTTAQANMDAYFQVLSLIFLNILLLLCYYMIPMVVAIEISPLPSISCDGIIRVNYDDLLFCLQVGRARS